ncbi:MULTISPECIES: MIP/aquaporin family protein [Actinomadura]|uniref:MIP family channel protein n=1 Tax=Actinomadura litoris TaxID=2678616 RepID=A0A7K1LAR9_9ACTN|nr:MULTISPECIES: MIP/aquaporin family protein [Actinomadura]MBT2213083.1 aquaporin family protein [Actinomadura sp. NEAU-AAG7]MUN41514.1 MIP family channel protein [Actinomadura litoris]
MTRGPAMPELARELAAEFAGTLILILFGVGVVAQAVAGSGLGEPQSLGGHDAIAWAWGIAVTLGVYVSARISGGHINPAVTFALAVFKGFPWRKVGPFWIAQFLGAFVAALIVRWDYSEILAKFDPGHTAKTQFVFSTMPGNGSLPVGTWGAFRDQVIGTAILLFLVLALTDLRNSPPLANMAPLVIGLVVVAIGMAFGSDAGYAINPARDLGPRLAQYLTGYADAWRDQNGDLYFWVPIAGPLIGSIVGAALYILLIGRNIPEDEPPQPGGGEPRPEYDVT